MAARRLTLLAALLALAACTAPERRDDEGKVIETPVGCATRCQTTYSQCTGGCLAGQETASMCHEDCARVYSACVKTCEKPAKSEAGGG